MVRLVVLFTVLLVSEAHARTITVNSCVATIGDFCPVETGGAVLFGVALLFFAGVPLRMLIKRHIVRQTQASATYQPSGVTLFFYQHAGQLTLIACGLVIAAIVIPQL